MSLRPSILTELTLSDQSKTQFEMSILRFHQLRYFVAKTLKDMEDLEQLNILKIDS